MNLKKIIDVIRSFPKSAYINIKYLPFNQAFKLPILIYHKSEVDIHGKILINESYDNIKTGMIRIGFNREKHIDPSLHSILYLESNSSMIFNGEAHIGYGSKIIIHKNGRLELGKKFNVSSNIIIRVSKSVIIKDDVLFSWDCEVLDSDSHKIYKSPVSISNPDKEIQIGNHVWIGNGVQILKGSKIPDNCVIASKSRITNTVFQDSTIIKSGCIANSCKKIYKWEK